jgi:hypothetical protein
MQWQKSVRLDRVEFVPGSEYVQPLDRFWLLLKRCQPITSGITLTLLQCVLNSSKGVFGEFWPFWHCRRDFRFQLTGWRHRARRDARRTGFSIHLGRCLPIGQ